MRTAKAREDFNILINKVDMYMWKMKKLMIDELMLRDYEIDRLKRKCGEILPYESYLYECPKCKKEVKDMYPLRDVLGMICPHCEKETHLIPKYPNHPLLS